MNKIYITEGLIEQHIHGCFGVDFMTCDKDGLIFVAEELYKCGVGTFFPTIMTEEISKIKNRIKLIKSTMNLISKKMAQIGGIHLEGPFINKDKSGIHPKEYIQPLDINIFKQIEDDVIKIVTLAPELDKTGSFIKYLKTKDIKVSAGHCISTDLSQVEQVTHLYNAMGNFFHRNPSTVVSALMNDNIYTELIADSRHVCDDVLKMTFKLKPMNKILLVSDALPLAHSDKQEHIFAGQPIYNKNGTLLSKDNTIAGSSMLLCDIIQNLVAKKIVNFKSAIEMASSNQILFHHLNNKIKVSWDNNFHIVGIDYINI